MEYDKQLIADLHTVVEKDGKHPVLVERIKALTTVKGRFELVAGLEQLIEDCKTKDVPNDRATLMLIKHIYRKYTS
jgi:hypothetical protein